jgi:hypothetical protein
MMDNNIFFSYGENCKDNTKTLSVVDLVSLKDQIISITSPLVAQTELLRKVQNYSKERYRTMKTQLPFICCSAFEPKIRKYENFVSTIGWILDIDMTFKMEAALYKLLINDPRVAFYFTSPNGYGLKLIFLFSEPFTDKLAYKSAYKNFSQEFGLKYNILDKIDLVNCDISRISFICHDLQAGINPLYNPLDINTYLPQVLPFTIEVKQVEKNEIPAITYKNILERLGNKPKPIQSDPHVPAKVLQATEMLSLMLKDMNIEVIEYEKVQYGMKLKARMNNDIGEIIIYYGKKGWSIVSSARKELNHELNEVMKKSSEYYLMTTMIL